MTANPLVEILRPAFAPCRNFGNGNACQSLRWEPKTGYVPSGFGGAKGIPADVRLVIVTAEPGSPLPGDQYVGSPGAMIAQELSWFDKYMYEKKINGKSRFYPNLRVILDLFWPDLTLSERLKVTWITTSVKCCATKTGDKVARTAEHACITTYLKRELDLFQNAYVLALGGKAKVRLNRAHIHIDGWAQHPSARSVNKPEASWKTAAGCFRAWLGQRPTTIPLPGGCAR